MKKLLKNISRSLIVIFIVLLVNTNTVFCDDDKTLTISYTCVTKVIATFIDDLSGDTTIQEHEIEDKLVEPSHDDNDDYEFLGWFIDKTKWNFENDVITNNITLHGKYKKIVIPIFDIPHTGIYGIDAFVETIKTNTSYSDLILIALSILILIIFSIFIFYIKDKDDNELIKRYKK